MNLATPISMDLVGTYNLGLVIASVLIATLASYAALDLSSRIATSKGHIRSY